MLCRRVLRFRNSACISAKIAETSTTYTEISTSSLGCRLHDGAENTSGYSLQHIDGSDRSSFQDHSRRFFSSNARGILHSKWNNSTKKLLDREETTLGSLDSLKWQLAETMIIYWAETDGVVGLNNCFQLLDRLVEEAAAVNNKDAVDDESFQHHLNIYLVHAVLKRWNQLMRQSDMTILLPSQLLEKVDSYLARAKCFTPNIVTYTIILDGAARCAIPQERLQFTEQLLLRLIEEADTNPLVRPTIVSFGTAINAWAKSGNRAAAEKAESLIWRVQELHERGWPDMEPNNRIYTSAINAWANAGDPQRAEALLKTMYKEYALNGKEAMKPNAWSFNAALAAWWKSSSPQAFESAEALLRLMIELNDKGGLDIPPDATSFNCLLHKLTQRRGDPNAFSKGEALVNEMFERGSKGRGDKGVQPNLNTFTTLFRLMATSNIPDQEEKTKFWLEKAASVGLNEERNLLDQYYTTRSQIMRQTKGSVGHKVARPPPQNRNQD